MLSAWEKVHTVCPRSSDPFYRVTHYITWVSTSWTYNMYLLELLRYKPVTTENKDKLFIGS